MSVELVAVILDTPARELMICWNMQCYAT